MWACGRGSRLRREGCNLQPLLLALLLWNLLLTVSSSTRLQREIAAAMDKGPAKFPMGVVRSDEVV
jgi:hypothetical protein